MFILHAYIHCGVTNKLPFSGLCFCCYLDMVIVSLYMQFVIALPTVTEYMIYYLTVTTKCPVLNRKKKRMSN